VNSATVFSKTDLGASEVRSHRGTLPAPARQLLILIDGQRTLAELARLVGASRLESLLLQLGDAGFVRRDDAAPWGAWTAEHPPPVESFEEDADVRTQAIAASVLHRGLSPWVLVGAVAFSLLAAAAAMTWLFPHPAPPDAQDLAVVVTAPTEFSASPARADHAAPGPATSPNRTEPAPTPAGARPAPGAESAAALRKARPATDKAPGAAQAEPATSSGASAPDEAPQEATRTASAEPRARTPAPREASHPAAPASATPVALAPVQPPASAAAQAAAQSSALANAQTPPQSPSTAAPPPSPLVVLERVTPDFPRKAYRSGVDHGDVSARLHVGADGAVVDVDILKADPPGFFEDAVRNAAMQWKFAPPGSPAVRNVKFEFKS
jgi:TonB family protein